MKTKRQDLTQGDVFNTLKSLTIPMIFGILGIVAFNLADTYFVGKLGTTQMAALTFTFPVVLIINSLNLGLGIGASAVISKAVGENNFDKVKRLSTDSLSLGVLFAMIAMVIGFLTIDPLFRALGAEGEALGYIKDYMSIWYAGVPFIVIPMIGNNAIRALGDTKTPSMVMMISAGLNIIFDPLLIFGIGIFPELGVQGAAIATVLSRSITFLVSMYILAIREKVISLKVIHVKTLLDSWRQILFIGLPTAVSRMIMPFGLGIITSLIAGFGESAVAGYGIATRIEYFALTFVGALSSILPVFVGQNFGGKRFDRIKKALNISEKFAVVSGLAIYVVLFILANPVANIFTKQPDVAKTVVLYLRIVPLGYTMQGVLQVLNGTLNALHKPLKAAMLNLVQMLVVYVPLALILTPILGLKAIFISLVFSFVLLGTIGHFITKNEIETFMK